ncbi:MAG: cryptochrome/photolyase family protein [Gammaproteobacteria bacterium]
MTTVFPLLGNQLFPPELLEPHRDAHFVMVEDAGLCRYQPHHQQKLVLMLTAMRAHAAELRARGFTLTYRRLDDDDNRGLLACLGELAGRLRATTLRHFEVLGRRTRADVADCAARYGLRQEVLASPMFLTTLDEFDAHLSRDRRPFMARFYRRVRQRHRILLDADGGPRGGRWSFDADNRQRLPRGRVPPGWPPVERTREVETVIELVRREFPAHPGDARNFHWPVTRIEALAWLDDFVQRRLADFGPWQDALTQRSDLVYHAALSPLLNLGLLTPREVLFRVLDHAAVHDVAPNSLEGFVRQLLGWREFVRGVHERFGAEQARRNFFEHRRLPGPAWWRGETGIPPLDDAIRGALARGWNHHIQRLMVVGNLMLLAEIAPREAYRWFMAMYVDAYGWVMEANVYGMALYSDGGLFATKPYACGANYLLKMSDYRRGPWCDVVDGLYWRFVARHRDFFAGHPRLGMLVGNLDRMDTARRERIDAAARQFLDRHTTLPRAAG